MSGKDIFLLTMMIFATSILVKSKRDYILELDYITPVVTDIPFIKRLNFSLTNKKAANMDLMMKRNITKWPVKLSVYMLTKSKKRISLQHTTFEVCESFRDKRWNKFIGVFLNELLDKSNLPRKCPFVENVLYTVRNYTIDEECYPPILPDGSWEFTLNLNNAEPKTGIVTISGRVKNK
uniref:MD-2-related lipid-recognition domain-containing protein n=1 Tax=Musca domestica TaxID=7370 RepID=A0A1I8NK23_MUSDO